LQETHGSSNFLIHVGGHFSTKTIVSRLLGKDNIGLQSFVTLIVFRDLMTSDLKICWERTLFNHAITTCPPIISLFKVGIRFIGPINPPSSVGKVFILKATEYFKKWEEVLPLKHSTDDQVISFLENNIFSRFGLPLEIIIENGLSFISAKLT
jgi:hypothetical protein